jgi:hypothetical protein
MQINKNQCLAVARPQATHPKRLQAKKPQAKKPKRNKPQAKQDLSETCKNGELNHLWGIDSLLKAAVILLPECLAPAMFLAEGPI